MQQFILKLYIVLYSLTICLIKHGTQTASTSDTDLCTVIEVEESQFIALGNFS